MQVPSHPLRNDVVGGIQYDHCSRPDVRDFKTRLSFKEIVERNQASVLLEYDVLEYLPAPSTHSAILSASAPHLACSQCECDILSKLGMDNSYMLCSSTTSIVAVDSLLEIGKTGQGWIRGSLAWPPIADHKAVDITWTTLRFL